MIRKFVITFFCIVLLAMAAPQPAHAFSFTTITKFVSWAKKIKGYYDNLNNYTSGSNIAGYIPHSFPFGGHITSSEQACSLKWDIWTWIYPLGIPVPIWCPSCGYFPLGGSAIEVGPPVPTNGKVITFPYVSDIYNNHNEGIVGPWALGLGFTPFPLDEINLILGAITISDNPATEASGCPGLPYTTTYCFDKFHLVCSSSGEKDLGGKDIIKVILKLGTS